MTFPNVNNHVEIVVLLEEQVHALDERTVILYHIYLVLANGNTSNILLFL